MIFVILDNNQYRMCISPKFHLLSNFARKKFTLANIITTRKAYSLLAVLVFSPGHLFCQITAPFQSLVISPGLQTRLNSGTTFREMPDPSVSIIQRCILGKFTIGLSSEKLCSLTYFCNGWQTFLFGHLIKSPTVQIHFRVSNDHFYESRNFAIDYRIKKLKINPLCVIPLMK